jgi:hypothetical protein
MDLTRRQLTILAVLALAGCNQAREQAADRERLNQRMAQAEARDDLKKIYDAYVAYYRKAKKPPESLEKMRAELGEESEGVKALATGKYVLEWGLAQEDHLDDEATTVLAYEAEVPTRGGQAVMLNGTVLERLEAARFADLARNSKKKGDRP